MTEREVPASFGQRLLWLLQRSVGDSGALNCPVILRLRGPLEPATLAAGLDRLVARHEALRTTFTGAAHRLVQVVHEPRPVQLECADLRAAADPAAALTEALAAELGRPVDFTQWPTRTRLWRTGPAEHVLCLTMHHLVTDAFSCGLLYRELGAALDRVAGGAPEPPPPRWQYADFSAWQHDFFASPAAERYRAFWLRQLDGVALPGVPIQARTAQRNRTTAIARGTIPGPATDSLRLLAKAERTTLFAVMLAVYYAALRGETGQEDLSVTSLFANRAQREVAETVGFVANMVVLRSALPPRASLRELVRRSATTARDAFLHERLPYQLLPAPSSNTERQRVEDVVFQMLGEPITVAIRAAGLSLEGIIPQGVARFDLELAVIPDGAGLAVQLFYARDRLDDAWAQAFVDSYCALARAAAYRPDVAVTSLLSRAPVAPAPLQENHV